METEERADAVHVALHGEFDMARAEEVETHLAHVSRDGAERRVVLDLRGLTFLDSSGLRVIIMAGARSRRDGPPLTVVRGPEQVQSVFEITGMDRELRMVDDPTEAPPEERAGEA